MEHQYLVKTDGEVKVLKDKVFVIKAGSEQEAEDLAVQQFQRKYGAVDISVDTAVPRSNRVFAAMICFAIVLFLSAWDWTVGHNTYSIRPDLISTIAAISLYAAYILKYKGIERLSEQHISDWLLDAFLVLVIASFAQSVIGIEIENPVLNAIYKIFDIQPLTSTQVLIFTVVLSWIGMKLVSVMCMGFLGVIAISNLLYLNEAMNIWGIVYAMAAFIGLVLYATVEPAFVQASPDFLNSLGSGTRYIKNDVNEAKISAGKIKKGLNDKADKLKKLSKKK